MEGERIPNSKIQNFLDCYANRKYILQAKQNDRNTKNKK